MCGFARTARCAHPSLRRTLITQLRSIAVIVISFGLQDATREFYMDGRTTSVLQTNFIIALGLGVVAIIMLTMIETFISSWERASVRRWELAHKQSLRFSQGSQRPSFK